MALKNLTDVFQSLTLEPKYLLFSPSGDRAWLREKFDDIPRYLFRISTPKSDGTTDRFCVKSKDAKYARASSKVDIFAQNDNRRVAGELNKHLCWWGEPEDMDNLVSWTSSLLFALQYVIYRHNHPKDGSSLDEIFLCIIDTTAFPKGVFLRDMALIQAYQHYDGNLQKLGALRNKKHRNFTGSYYFGEYLSQGALNVEDKCQMISAQAMIDRGLFLLRPEFRESMLNKELSWANQVVRLREPFYGNTGDRQQVSSEELQAAIDIAEIFGSRWRLPMAFNLIALLPRQAEDNAIVKAFSRPLFTDEERQECSPSKTKIRAYQTLPELKHFENIMRSVYKDFCQTKLMGELIAAEPHLRSAMIFASIYPGDEAARRRLAMIVLLAQHLEEMMLPVD